MILFGRKRRNATAVAFARNYQVIAPEPVTPRLAVDASPIGQAVILALIADKTGRILAELTPDIQHCSWLLSNYGEASLVFAADDPAVTSGIVAPGRRVLLRFDNGLPPWGGVIDVPVDLNGVTSTYRAYEAPYLLKWRLTGANLTGTMNLATLATAAMNAANDAEPTGISLRTLGEIDYDLAVDYHYTPVADVLADIAARAEFYTVGRLGAGIEFDMYLGETVGRDRSGQVWLIQGVNMQRPQVVIQGPIVNQVVAAEKDGSWDVEAADAREILIQSDTASVYAYGLRQELIQTDDNETLSGAATGHLEEFALPYSALATDVLNLAPATFGQYDLGDTISVLLLEAYGGQETTRRVIGREFRPADGVCTVILK